MSDSSGLAAQVSAARERVDVAARQQARIEAEAEAAQREAQRAMARLSEEFGVASVEDALSLLADLERQIEAALGAIDTQLAAAGEVDEIVQCSVPSR